MSDESRVVLHAAIVAATADILDRPLGFDPTEDLLVPTTEDEAHRIAAAALAIVDEERKHVFGGVFQTTFSDSPEPWSGNCLCKTYFHAGTKTAVVKLHTAHLTHHLTAVQVGEQ
jgi:hypothetical protein